MGAITIVSALMFMLLRAKDGNNLIKERHKSKTDPRTVKTGVLKSLLLQGVGCAIR